jgi:tRNA-2-methylthio-N6-dimethylallyladenosine synthase
MSATLSLQTVDASYPRESRKGTYFIQTWGCQMNEDDSAQLSLGLESIGFAPANSIHEAHVILLNTCSVRRKPEDKAFSMLGQLALMKRKRPEIVVGVCGCMAQLRAEEIRRRAPFLDFVAGTGAIEGVAGLVEETLQSRRFRSRLDLPPRRGAVVTDVPGRLAPGDSSREPGNRRLKAFVPIQFGCDKFCTFCIVPSTRGRERSRPTGDILREVRALAALGVKEVTLLGQTVNSYGKNLAEGRVPFSKLLWLLSGIDGLERIRYTSPYPRDFKADLVECIRDCRKVMEHVHLPMQSGDDRVLGAMKRQYDMNGFRSIVEAIRRAVPDCGLTTDIIVGFPGETDEQFQMTLAAVEEFRFDGAFMFAYSPRPGTPASNMDQVPGATKRARLQALIELQSRITLERNAQWVGRPMEVLVEGRSAKEPSMLQGYSRQFRMVHFPGPESWRGSLVTIEGVSPHAWGVFGKPV